MMSSLHFRFTALCAARKRQSSEPAEGHPAVIQLLEAAAAAAAAAADTSADKAGGGGAGA